MAQELLAELQRRGIRLRLADGRLEVLAPAGALTPDLRGQLASRRDELIALLGSTVTAQETAGITPAPQAWHEPFALTDIQHAYWVGRGSAVELGGVSSHYYFELERSGLDPARLEASLRRVIARHDMLRAVIEPDGRQRILPEVPGYQMPVVDLRAVTAQVRDKELARIRAEMDHLVLPSDRWPLFDIRASLLPDDRVRLHVSLDVLILDGFSLYVLFNDWRRCYEEPGWRPAPLAVSYRDHVVHEQAERDAGHYAADERYWLDRVDSLPPAPALPMARQPSEVGRPEFTRRGARLPRERWAAIKRRAKERGLTPSAVLMSAFGDVLRRWSGQPSFTLNLTLFNRPATHPDLSEVIGDFTSVSLLAVEAADEPFAGRTRRLAQQLMRDLEHSSYSGIRVLRERARRLGGGPSAAMPVVFTSALVLGTSENDPSAGIRFFGEEVYAITQTPQVWLDHQVAEEAGELVFNWDAVEALFPAGLLDDMFASYRAALDELSDEEAAWDRTGPLAALPAWQAGERDAANATAAAIPQTTLYELVAAQVARTPASVAVAAQDGTLTYRQLADHAHHLAHRLGQLGTQPGTLVGVVLDKGWRQVPAVLGVLAAGAAYLPIDPGWPTARRHELLTAGGVRQVVTTPTLRDTLTWPDGIQVVTFSDPEVGQASDAPPTRAPAPGDLAYVIFTSGSTGQPKGVMIDHRGAANTVQDINQRFGVGPADRVLALSALSFDLSVYDIFGPLAVGGTVVLPSAAGAHDPAHWAELLDRHGVTVWNSVPALMRAWVDAGPRLDPAVAARLRLVLLSGDWIPVSLPAAVRALHAEARLISLGGATEASIWSVCYPIGEVPADWVRIPYGKPLANQTMYVHDDRFQPCPVWTAGEIYIGGTGVALGYWADPDRTAERFVTHPATGERLYRTGDLGRYLPGGDIEFLGRQDSQVKLNGYRIELGEIAAALRRLPGVGDAVLSVATNPGTGRRQLVAHVTPATEAIVPEPTASADAAEPSQEWSRIIEAGGSALARNLSDLAGELASYRAVWHAVEELAAPMMARSLARLGAFGAAGATATAAEIVEAHQVKPSYRGVLDQWLAVLANEGILVGDEPGRYRCRTPLDADGFDRLVRDGFMALDAPPALRILLDYVVACADNHVELLTGRVNPLELLLPGGDTRIADAMYADNPVSALQNRIAARAVRSFAEHRPPGRPVHILEVGAGTGSTTAQVLRELPPTRAHYSFTDVSSYFMERAKAAFRAYPFVDYSTFDIDREPATQGVMPGSVDLVIAANVLHDAKDLDRSLRQLGSVLTSGGVLLLIEGTANSRVQMISVGLIEGLGHYQDQRELPLLSVQQWRDRLLAAGFGRFAAIPEGAAAVDAHVQHVLLAAAPDDRVRLSAATLAQQVGELLPDYMVPRHYLILDRFPLTANGKIDRAALPAPWTDTRPTEPAAPADPVQQRLYEIWCEVLGRTDIGVRDNFFEVGGDSLHAVTILGRLREEFGVDAAADEGLEMLFDNATIVELAVAIGERARS